MNTEIKKTETEQCNIPVVVGCFVSWPLDCWDQFDNHFSKIVNSKVIRMVIDPLSRHETKYIVEVEGENYGIPLSEIMGATPPNGSQLSLF